MHLQHETDLGSLFDYLADVESGRAREVDERATARFGRTPDPETVLPELPAPFDEEEARSAGLTPYRALAVAVQNGEGAFIFYSYIAAHAKTVELRELAEQLAQEELSHTGLLRQERRRAWRAQPVPPVPSEPQPETLEMLLGEAVSTERAAAAAHQDLAARLRAGGNPKAAAPFAAAALDEEDLARTLAARLPPGAASAGRALDAPSPRDGLRLLELAFERYAQIAERATMEDVLLEAQALSERALRRLTDAHGALDKRAACEAR
jgi:rubrerythrin